MILLYNRFLLPLIFPGSSSRLEEKMHDLQRQMSLMTDEIRKMAAILNEFANCRACIKKLYKTALEPGKSTVIISELPAETNPTKPLLTPPQTTGTPKPDKPEVKFLNQAKTSNLTPTTPMQKNAIANVMLIGSPSRGVYVPEARLESIKASCPKRFALKLFELVFGRDEAKDGSVEGKGEKLSRLDPNRLAAVHEEVERRFPEDENYTWSEIKRAIDEKCRMVRNNRCFVWAGVNVKSD